MHVLYLGDLGVRRGLKTTTAPFLYILFSMRRRSSEGAGVGAGGGRLDVFEERVAVDLRPSREKKMAGSRARAARAAVSGRYVGPRRPAERGEGLSPAAIIYKPWYYI